MDSNTDTKKEKDSFLSTLNNILNIQSSSTSLPNISNIDNYENSKNKDSESRKKEQDMNGNGNGGGGGGGKVEFKCSSINSINSNSSNNSMVISAPSPTNIDNNISPITSPANEKINFINHIKLVKFFNTDSNSFKRLKGFLGFVVSSSPHEIKLFHRSHFSTLYQVSFDCLHYFDTLLRQNEIVDVNDIVTTLHVIYNLLQDISDHIQKRWQLRSMQNILNDLMRYEQPKVVRSKAFEILIFLIDILGEETALLNIFSIALPFYILCEPKSKSEDYFYSRFPNTTIELNFSRASSNSLEAIAPSSPRPYYSFVNELSKESESSLIAYKSILKNLEDCSSELFNSNPNFSLLKIFLIFISSPTRQSRFSFWIKHFYTRIALVLFPSKDTNIEGFKNCPTILLALLCPWLNSVLDNQVYRSIVSASPEYMKLLMEIIKQSVMLPFEYSNSIQQVISGFSKLMQNVSTEVHGEMQIYLQLFLSHSFHLLYVSAKDSLETKISLCNQVIEFYSLLAEEPFMKLGRDTWESLLITVLNGCNYMIHAETHSNIVESLTIPLIKALFECYIKYYHFIDTNPQEVDTFSKLWEAVQVKVNTWASSTSFIDQWKLKIISKTELLMTTLTTASITYSDTVQSGSLIDFNCDPMLNQIWKDWDFILHFISCPELLDVQRFSVWLCTVIEAIEIFIAYNQKVSDFKRHCLPTLNTLLGIFAPWIFELGADSENIDLQIKSVIILCKLFCMRTSEDIDDIYIAKFVEVIHDGLNGNYTALRSAIIEHSTSLFQLNIGGIEILVMDYLNAIKIVLLNPSFLQVRISALTILNSFLSYPLLFEGLQFHSFDSIAISTSSLFSYLLELLPAVVDINNNIHSTILWTYYCLLYFSITPEQFNFIINIFITKTIDTISHSTAIDCIRTLFLSEKIKLSSSDNLLIYKGLINSCYYYLKDIRDINSKPVIQLLYCLQDFLMTSRYLNFNERQLFFDLLEFVSKTATSCNVEETKTVLLENCNFIHSHLMNNYSLWQNELMFKETTTVSNNASSFIDSSEFLEDSDDYFQFISLPSTIVTIHPSTINSIKMVIRDATGKYTWDLKESRDICNVVRCLPTSNLEIKHKSILEKVTLKELSDGEIQFFKDGEHTFGSLQLILSSLRSSNVERFEEFKNAEIDSLAPLNPYFSYIQQPVDKDWLAILRSFLSKFVFLPLLYCKTMTPIDMIDYYTLNRDAASISPESIRHDGEYLSPGLTMLNMSSKLKRSVKLLDQQACRECHKIGVIYVGPQQDSQKEILRNTKGSDLYEEFIHELGWLVNVQKHTGFLGGLDPRLTTGLYTPYWSNDTTEMIFHVVSRMPTNYPDRQQIHKKRQVGNDHVHIVWCEFERDYLPSMITSHFNDVHIIIYPLVNGLFRIQIRRKEEKVPLFGPLLDGMTVPKSILAPLVRLTALNANRSVRYNTPGYTRPFLARKKYIEDIISRYSLILSPSEYLEQLITKNQQPDLDRSPSSVNFEARTPL